MVEQDDWRLCGQEKYLKGVPLYFLHFQPYSQTWDHEHCEFCWAKFSQRAGDLQAGYCTEPENTRGARWICPACYEDLKEMFGWTLEKG